MEKHLLKVAIGKIIGDTNMEIVDGSHLFEYLSMQKPINNGFTKYLVFNFSNLK